MRLIDADELINMVEDTYSGYMLDESACPCDFIKLIDEMADMVEQKESEDKE